MTEKQNKYIRASPLERAIAVVPLGIATFAFAVADMAESFSTNSGRKHYSSLKDDGRNQLDELGRIVFYGQKPAYMTQEYRAVRDYSRNGN